MTNRKRWYLLCLAGLSVLVLGTESTLAGPIKVYQAWPNYGNQGQFDWPVKIRGEGFGNNAVVTFYVTGTSLTGGVTVHSETYDAATGDLDVLVDLPFGATLADYDIVVTRGRRKGKGTTLFKVLEPGKLPSPGNDSNPITMTCALNEKGNGKATFKNDKHLTDVGSPYYFAKLDKVQCQSGGSDPAGLRLRTVGAGSLKNAVRFVDLAFGTCTDGSECLRDEFLHKSPDSVILDIKPVASDPDANHIHLMQPRSYTEPYKMTAGIRPMDFAERYKIELSAENNDPDFLRSSLCHADAPGFIPGKNVNVHIWQDGVFDGIPDGLPDGYTVTTGTITGPESFGAPPIVSPGKLKAAVCSNVSATGDPCPEDKRKQARCHFLGNVKVRFTLHMQYQP